MPPKKDKKADASDTVSPADDTAKAALEILSLQEKLRSASERLVALEAEHKKVVAQLAAQKADQKEIFEYLNLQMRTLSQQVRQARRESARISASFCADVLQVLAKDQAIRDTEDRTQKRELELEKKLQEQQEAQRASMSTLQQQIASYEEELLALQSFQQKRMKLEQDLQEAKAFIENERLRHKNALQVPQRARALESQGVLLSSAWRNA
jgi:DNA repair exonuclease SbcCD ATPase subunit